MSFETSSMQFLFWSGSISIVLLVIAIVFWMRNKRFEKIERHPGINAVLFGIVMMVVTSLVYLIDFALKAYPTQTAKYLTSIEQYIPIAIQIVEVGVMPLMAICLLIGVFYLRESN